MDPVLLPTLLAAATEAVRVGVGAKQNRMGKDIDATMVRPKDYITESDKSSLMIAKMMAGLRELPGAGSIMEGAEATAANAIRESKMGGNVDIATISKNLMDARENLGVQTANMINSNTQVLMNSLNRYGALEKDVFNYNEKQRYMEGVTMAANLRNSGISNMFNGLSNVAAAGIGAHSTKMSTDVYQELINLYKDNLTTPVNEKTAELTTKPTTPATTAKRPADLFAMNMTDANSDNPMVQNIFDMVMSNPRMLDSSFASPINTAKPVIPLMGVGQPDMTPLAPLSLYTTY